MAQEQRRTLLRRRRALATGVMGAAALMAPQAAQATVFTVTQNGDSGVGSLRDAVAQANANSVEDEIRFDPSVNGTLIRLTTGALPITANEGLTITGPGRSELTVSGDADASATPNAGDSRVFDITANSNAVVAISGLTLTRGFDPANGSGGAINVSSGATLKLTDAAITNSRSNSNGGGLFLTGDFAIAGSTISGNTAISGAGVYQSSSGPFSGAGTIADTTISGNQATLNPTLSVGGGVRTSAGSLTIERSSLSGNTATVAGGGVWANNKYGLTVNNSTISGNSSAAGGGMFLSANSPKYAPMRIAETTVSGNTAAHGAGIDVRNIRGGNKVAIARSTISGNDGGPGSWGGGILVDDYITGAVSVVDSTVSGNTATAGGGVSLGSDSNYHLTTTYQGNVGTIDFDNSTISGNTASAHGGGIYLSQYDGGSPTVKQSGTAGITSTIVADNTVAGAAEDLDRVDTSTNGGFAGAFSLVEAPGDAPLTQQSVLVGVDPQLGALGDNGGPTATLLPAGTSPVLDQGRSPSKLKVDQRNAARLVDTALPNPPSGGDGTDIGAVELAADAVVIPPTPKASFAVSVRGKPISAGAPLLPATLTPLDCGVTVVTMTSCNVQLRSPAAAKAGKKTSIPKGALLAEGVGTAAAGATQLSLKVTLTKDGAALLKARPLGIDVLAAATAATDPTSAMTTTGTVHLLAGPSVTLPLGTRSTKLSKAVTKQLDQLAKLIPDAKTVTCTAYSDKGKGDVKLTKAQAKAACARLVKSGVKGKVTSTGKGHIKPVASTRTLAGRKANRRVVVRFTL